MADLSLSRVDSVNITPDRNFLGVEIEGANDDDVLGTYSLDEIIEHFGQDKILDEIGKEEVMSYFGIEEG